MINIDVRIIGALMKPSGRSEFQYDCRDGMSLAELLLDLKYSARHVEHIMTAVNGEKKNHDFILRDGDTVALSTMVGGG